MAELLNASFLKRIEKLEGLIRHLNETLAEHTELLKKHAAAMEKLFQEAKYLETAIKTGSGRESRKPSLQLKQAVDAFVDYAINQHFYKDSPYLKLNRADRSFYPDMVPGGTIPDSENDLEH